MPNNSKVHPFSTRRGSSVGSVYGVYTSGPVIGPRVQLKTRKYVYETLCSQQMLTINVAKFTMCN